MYCVSKKCGPCPAASHCHWMRRRPGKLVEPWLVSEEIQWKPPTGYTPNSYRLLSLNHGGEGWPRSIVLDMYFSHPPNGPMSSGSISEGRTRISQVYPHSNPTDRFICNVGCKSRAVTAKKLWRNFPGLIRDSSTFFWPNTWDAEQYLENAIGANCRDQPDEKYLKGFPCHLRLTWPKCFVWLVVYFILHYVSIIKVSLPI